PLEDGAVLERHGVGEGALRRERAEQEGGQGRAGPAPQETQGVSEHRRHAAVSRRWGRWSGLASAQALERQAEFCDGHIDLAALRAARIEHFLVLPEQAAHLLVAPDLLADLPARVVAPPGL